MGGQPIGKKSKSKMTTEKFERESQLSLLKQVLMILRAFLNIGSIIIMALGCLNYIPLGLIELDVIDAALGWHPLLPRVAYTAVAVSFLYIALSVLYVMLPDLIRFAGLTQKIREEASARNKDIKNKRYRILLLVLIVFFLVAIGCLNYGAMGMFEVNILEKLFAPSPLLLRIGYVIIGLAGPIGFSVFFWDPGSRASY